MFYCNLNFNDNFTLPFLIFNFYFFSRFAVNDDCSGEVIVQGATFFVENRQQKSQTENQQTERITDQMTNQNRDEGRSGAVGFDDSHAGQHFADALTAEQWQNDEICQNKENRYQYSGVADFAVEEFCRFDARHFADDQTQHGNRNEQNVINQNRAATQ